MAIQVMGNKNHLFFMKRAIFEFFYFLLVKFVKIFWNNGSYSVELWCKSKTEKLNCLS